MLGSGCVQTSRHIVFDEYFNFGAEDTVEQKAKRTSVLATGVAALEQRPSALPKRDTASSRVIWAAACGTSYFVANAGVLDKASPYIQERCTSFHGKLIKDVLLLQYQNAKGKTKNYHPGDLEYDLNCRWRVLSDTPPSPFTPTPPSCSFVCAAIPCSSPSIADVAADDAVFPVAEFGPRPVSLPLHDPAFASSIPKGISALDVNAMGRPTTPDRSDIAQYIAHGTLPKLEILGSLSS
jgi:hypothetical protein